MRYEHAGDGPAPIMVADAVNFTKGRRTALWRTSESRDFMFFGLFSDDERVRLAVKRLKRPVAVAGEICPQGRTCDSA